MGNLDERTKMLLFAKFLVKNRSMYELENGTDEWYIQELDYFLKYTLDRYVEHGVYLDKRELIEKYEQPGRED